MTARLFPVFVLACALANATSAQDAPPGPPSESPSGQGGWQGRGGRGGMMGMGRGTIGTVTEAAGDHYTVKTELGENFVVHFSVNTRIMKQAPGPARRSEGDPGERTPPTPIKPGEIKVGDVIAASGEVDADTKSVGAIFVMLIDPERAKEMRAMEANFGKTWLAGRVTAINEVTVTLEGGPGNTVHTFVADENTAFRKRRDPITLADIQVGDFVRAEGAVKSGAFVASSVAVMSPQPAGGPNHGARVPGQPPPQ